MKIIMLPLEYTKYSVNVVVISTLIFDGENYLYQLNMLKTPGLEEYYAVGQQNIFIPESELQEFIPIKE